jgi:hypothetical protein
MGVRILPVLLQLRFSKYRIRQKKNATFSKKNAQVHDIFIETKNEILGIFSIENLVQYFIYISTSKREIIIFSNYFV